MRRVCQAALTFKSVFDSELLITLDLQTVQDSKGGGRGGGGSEEVGGSSYPASIFNEVIPKKPCWDTERFIYSLAMENLFFFPLEPNIFQLLGW